MNIGLALSGGGMRAAAFHAGVLLRIADEGHLERVSQISTVSGGSLVTAAIYAQADMQWPSSQKFKDDTYWKIRKLISETDLLSVKSVGFKGALKFNIKLLIRRAEILSQNLHSQWGIKGNLNELPDEPCWWINTTCYETGKNWRFSKREMGDWVFGRHYSPAISIAKAAAASAAVPYAIGALPIKLPKDGWYRTDPATRKPLERVNLSSESVRLWDGGVYENLGLETLFKSDKGLIGCDFLICSDASGPLPDIRRKSLFNILKGNLSSPRLFDISSDQIRGLRSRMLINAFNSKTADGILIRMGNSVRDMAIKSGSISNRETSDKYQSDQEVSISLNHPTGLKSIGNKNFDMISRHGYEAANSTLFHHGSGRFRTDYEWNSRS